MPNTVDYRSFNNRIDYQLNDKNRFFFRWLRSNYLEDAQDYTYETEIGLMNWDERRNPRIPLRPTGRTWSVRPRS